MPRSPARKRKVDCVICGRKFFTRHSQGKFCSIKCCKMGAQKNWRDYDQKNRPKRRLYQRQKYQRQKERVAMRVKKYRRTEAGKMMVKKCYQRSKERNPEKIAARTEVLKALRRRELVKKPCEKCGEYKVHAHHPDYSKPLYVQWLCVKHHAEIHKKEDNYV